MQYPFKNIFCFLFCKHTGCPLTLITFKKLTNVRIRVRFPLQDILNCPIFFITIAENSNIFKITVISSDS